MPFTLYDANLFVAYATPTDQSPFAIRYSPFAAVCALRHEFIRGLRLSYPYKSLKALGGEGVWY
jgi:hypothetical protein